MIGAISLIICLWLCCFHYKVRSETIIQILAKKLTFGLVYALHCAAASTVPIGKANFFKFWWDQECQALKDESISKHCTWKAADRPRDGPIAAAMRKATYEYKLLLRQKSFQSQLCFTNELHDALSDKDPTRFWKSWNAKFGH